MALCCQATSVDQVQHCHVVLPGNNELTHWPQGDLNEILDRIIFKPDLVFDC